MHWLFTAEFRTLQSEIDAASVFLPITVPHRIQSAATTDLRRHLLVRNHLWGSPFVGVSIGFGNGGCLAYHLWSRNRLILDSAPVADNLHTFVKTPSFGVLRLSGPDAEAFAQSQFANDVLALEPGQWQWSCWLSAKGRVLAIFALLRVSAGDLMLLLPDGGTEALQMALQKFVFRRKLQLTSPAVSLTCRFTPPRYAKGNRAATLADGALELDMGGEALHRTVIIGSTDADASISDAQWRQSDLQLGLPRLETSQLDAWTPQQLGLDRLNAFSVKKGCYPGQEIVARTHFLGKAKRAATLLSLTADVAAGTDVELNGVAIGRIASQSSGFALAVLPLEQPDGVLTVDGQPAPLQPFLTGLSR